MPHTLTKPASALFALVAALAIWTPTITPLALPSAATAVTTTPVLA